MHARDGVAMDRLYSRTKVFHFPEKLRAQAEGRHTAPLAVRIKPTNRCNHACGYCCFRTDGLPMSGGMDARDEIPADVMRGIVEDIVAMGVRAVTFSGGGEPLLYRPLAEAVARLSEAGVRVGVLTNGSRLEGAVARVLAGHATWVRVSMDAATADTYAAVRGVNPREFARVRRNIERFAALAAGRCEVGVNWVATRDNHTETGPFLALMKGLGVAHVKVSEAVVGTTFEANRDSVRPWHRAVRDAVREARVALEDEGFRVVDRLLDPDLPGAGGYDKPYSWCPFASWLTVIGADLCLYSCQDKAYTASGRLARLAGRSFREAWFSDETRARLDAVAPAPPASPGSPTRIVPCRDCRHHCVAHDKNLLLLDYLGADPDHLPFV